MDDKRDHEFAFHCLMGLAILLCISGGLICVSLPPAASISAFSAFLLGWTVGLFRRRPRPIELLAWLAGWGIWVAYYQSIAYPLFSRSLLDSLQYFL